MPAPPRWRFRRCRCNEVLPARFTLRSAEADPGSVEVARQAVGFDVDRPGPEQVQGRRACASDAAMFSSASFSVQTIDSRLLLGTTGSVAVRPLFATAFYVADRPLSISFGRIHRDDCHEHGSRAVCSNVCPPNLTRRTNSAGRHRRGGDGESGARV